MTRAAKAATMPEPLPLAASLAHALSRRAPGGLVPQLSRYTVASAVALGLDMSVFTGLTAAGTDPTLAGILGYTAGLVLHFALSWQLVFDAGGTGKSRGRLFAEFAASGLVGVAITAAVIAAATTGAGLAPVAAKAIAVAVSFAAVFMLRRTIVFAAMPERRG